MNFYNVKVDGNKISFTDGNSMVLNDEMADKLRNYKEVILGIRGEDIKFDPQNLDIFKENKQRAVEQLQFLVDEVMSSTSWKVTSPLRRVMRTLKRRK